MLLLIENRYSPSALRICLTISVMTIVEIGMSTCSNKVFIFKGAAFVCKVLHTNKNKIVFSLAVSLFFIITVTFVRKHLGKI